MCKDGVCLCLRNILHQLRIDALQTDIARTLIQILLALQLFPILDLADVRIAAIFGCYLHVCHVQIVDDDIGSAELVTFFSKNRSKICSFNGRFDQYGLALLNIQTDLCQGVGILSFHLSKIHLITPFHQDSYWQKPAFLCHSD